MSQKLFTRECCECGKKNCTLYSDDGKKYKCETCEFTEPKPKVVRVRKTTRSTV